MKEALRDRFAYSIMSVTLITENQLAYSADPESYMLVLGQTTADTVGYLRQIAHDSSPVF